MTNQTTENKDHNVGETEYWEECVLSVSDMINSGNYADARTKALKALEIAETFEPDDTRLGMTLEILAEIYYCTKQYEYGASTLVRLVELYKRSLGANHPDTATVILNLAMLFHAGGRYAKAEGAYQQALELNTKLLGKDDPHVKHIVAQYARLLKDSGRDQEAGVLLAEGAKESSEIKMKRSGQFEAFKPNDGNRLSS